MTISSIISIGLKAIKSVPKELWLIIVIVILSVLLLGTCAKNQKIQNDNERLNKNYSEISRKTNEYTKQVSLDKEAMEATIKALLDEKKDLKDVVDSLGIRVKNISSVRRYESVRYVRDTVTQIKWKMIGGLKQYSTTLDRCNLKVTSTWFEGDSLSNIDAEVKTDLTFINFKKRPKRFWFIRYGNWQYNEVVIDACAQDSVYVRENVEFQKVK